jgi:hypothetical protein
MYISPKFDLPEEDTEEIQTYNDLGVFNTYTAIG